MRLSLILACIALMLCVMVGCKPKTTVAAEKPDGYTKVEHPQWSREAVIYEVNMRQYTDSGTAKAFMEELPRLHDLGVDVLWFMPVHPISKLNRKGELGSYYAVADYKGFNPEYGTIDDFKEIVNQAHQLGMKVIIDWVPNHSGCDNAWVTEHPDWYAHNEQGEMYGPYDWTDVYKFDYSNPEMRKAMTDAFMYWIKEVDVDGFRCDVAMEVPTDYWNELRAEFNEVNPDIFLLAEASKPELQEEAFDMGYNWPMKDLFSEISATAGQYTFDKEKQFPERHAVDIDSLLALQAQQYPTDTYLMNMITNHDLNSWEGTEFERLGNLTDAFAVLSFTLPGMPLIYTGQETGLNRALEFFVKDVPPTFHPENEYFEFYKRLIHLKHSNKALQAGVEGGEMVRYPTTSPDLYIFSREKDGQKVLVLTNLGAEPQAIEYTAETPVVGDMINIFTTQSEELPVTLNPGEYRVYSTK